MGVRQIITEAMRNNGLGNNVRDAEPVIAEVERAEQQAVQTLIQFATGRGLSRADAERALTQAGLTVAAPQQAARPAQAAQGGDLGENSHAILVRLAGQVDALTAFARENGYRG
jgi:hypothetical protein